MLSLITLHFYSPSMVVVLFNLSRQTDRVAVVVIDVLGGGVVGGVLCDVTLSVVLAIEFYFYLCVCVCVCV